MLVSCSNWMVTLQTRVMSYQTSLKFCSRRLILTKNFACLDLDKIELLISSNLNLSFSVSQGVGFPHLSWLIFTTPNSCYSCWVAHTHTHTLSLSLSELWPSSLWGHTLQCSRINLCLWATISRVLPVSQPLCWQFVTDSPFLRHNSPLLSLPKQSMPTAAHTKNYWCCFKISKFIHFALHTTEIEESSPWTKLPLFLVFLIPLCLFTFPYERDKAKCSI